MREGETRVWAKTILLLPLLLPLPGRAQYVGKVGQGVDKPQPLRATAVYEFTGEMSKPNASRLVPVVVWDGQHYQPGALYLAQPEPLAVAPGTQYVLEQSGVPKGYFNIGSAGQLNGSWVGLGRYAAEVPKPTPAQLAASRHLPQLHGGHGKGRADDEDAGDDGPVLHRHADSETGDSPGDSAGKTAGGAGSAGAAPAPDPDRPTLHTRSGSSGDAGSSAPPPDPDRPVLHTSSGSGTTKADAAGASAPAPDADRPRLKAGRGAAAETVIAPDPDRPHLRYGAVSDEGRVMPTELKDVAGGLADGSDGSAGAADGKGAAGSSAPVKIGQVVGISDTSLDVGNPHPFAYSWASPEAAAQAEAGMHALALKALATAAQASFGPAAKADAALRAAVGQGSFGPGAGTAGTPTKASAGTKAAAKGARTAGAAAATQQSTPQQDPLQDPEFHAFELSYGGGTTYVYTAHTAPTGASRRYVTVMAQPDFYGKPEQLFAQTTRGDMLRQVPALHFIDAVDTDGDHRAELLFDEQTAPRGGEGVAQASQRQFAIYSVVGGAVTEVYTSDAR